MAANTSPIFTLTPRISWNQTSTSAVTSTTGTDGNIVSIFTAGTNGSKIEQVTILASATSSATVVRFWINNGSTPGTAANNTLIHEETMPAVTLSQVAADSTVVWNANIVLPANYVLRAAAGTATVALYVSAFGGDY